MGLRDMRERAAFLGGTCAWKSKHKRGTEILVEVPISTRHQKSEPEQIMGRDGTRPYQVGVAASHKTRKWDAVKRVLTGAERGR